MNIQNLIMNITVIFMTSDTDYAFFMNRGVRMFKVKKELIVALDIWYALNLELIIASEMLN